MNDIVNKLAALVGRDNVATDPASLEEFARDESFVPRLTPWAIGAARYGRGGPARRCLGQRDGDAAGAGELWRAALPRRHRAERARRRDGRPPPAGQGPPRRPAQPHGRHRARRHLCAAPRRAGRSGHACHAAAVPAGEQVRGREPARASADADPALQLPPARAAAQLRRGLGERRDHVHRRSRHRPGVAGGPVAGRRRAGRPQGTGADRLLPPAHRGAGHDGRRDVGGGQVRAAARRARVPVRCRPTSSTSWSTSPTGSTGSGSATRS